MQVKLSMNQRAVLSMQVKTSFVDHPGHEVVLLLGEFAGDG